jgi:hypothetical protein
MRKDPRIIHNKMPKFSDISTEGNACELKNIFMKETANYYANSDCICVEVVFDAIVSLTEDIALRYSRRESLHRVWEDHQCKLWFINERIRYLLDHD